nr:MAG TPA: hypothetical protein [Caudoviricetes sp.]
MVNDFHFKSSELFLLVFGRFKFFNLRKYYQK